MRPSVYTCSLDGVNDIVEEEYRNNTRLALQFSGGVKFPLSTAFFSSKQLDDGFVAFLRSFLHLEQKSRKKRKSSKSKLNKKGSKEDNKAESHKNDDQTTKEPTDLQDSIVSSEDDSGLSEEGYNSSDLTNDIDWDKEIDSWEKGRLSKQ